MEAYREVEHDESHAKVLRIRVVRGPPVGIVRVVVWRVHVVRLRVPTMVRESEGQTGGAEEWEVMSDE